MGESLAIQIVDNPEHSRVEGRTEDGRLAGFSQYYVRDGALVFFHTEVDDAFEGHGVGSQIAEGVVEFARDRGVKIVPQCDFIRGYLTKHPEAHDVLNEPLVDR